MTKQERNAGGAAANAGSEYQHRIGAFISALMIVGGELSFLVGSDQALGTPTSLSYETLEAIDDINVVTDQGSKVYIQAKRSVDKNVFRMVIEQFALQYRNETPGKGAIYSLVTSSRSSKTVSNHAKMVLEILRSAPSEDFSLSHNEDLQDIHDFLVDAGTMALKKFGLPHEDEDVRDFLWFIHIDVVDIEKYESMEKATLLLLFRHASNGAGFLWDRLLRDNASAASNRMTLEKAALEVKYQALLRGEGEVSRWFFDFDIDVKTIPVGIEYLMTEVPDDNATIAYLGIEGVSGGDVLIGAASRFDQDCLKTLRFFNDQCLLSNGMTFKLLARAASAVALRRIIESQGQIDIQKLEASGKKMIVYGDNVKPEASNKSRCARRFRPALFTAFNKNTDPSRCLICKQTAIEQGALMVEIEEEEIELEIGLVHAECWKPAHRVVGTVSGAFLDKFPLLRRFDADTYIRALPGGQGSFTSLPAEIPDTVFVLAWTGQDYNPDGTFCLRIELENGNHILAIHRGRVERLDKPAAQEKAIQMNEAIQSQAEKQDPMCVKITEDGHIYGRKSVIENTSNEPGDLIYATVVKVVRFEEKMAKVLDQYKNWYAPLCYFRRIDDQRILTIDQSIVLLTDAFSISSLAEGLKPLGIDLQEFETRVIASDTDFDRFAREMFRDVRYFVVDPMWDEEGYLSPKAKIARSPWAGSGMDKLVQT